MIDDVIERLKTSVPDLENRVEPIVELAAAMNSGRLPETANAIVSPAALRGGASDVGAGIFTQPFVEAVSVLLIARVYDQTGRRALAALRPLIMAVVEAVAGWAPGDQVGVFSLVRGGVVSLQKGVLLYQIEFAIEDELRITS